MRYDDRVTLLNTDYRKCVDASERVAWSVDSVIPPDAKLDFSRSFMPDAMFLAGRLSSLSADEKRKLNQIFGNSYRYLFYFVEAYIIASTMEHARAEVFGDPDALRALVRFADEEVKHQQLFVRAGELFDRDFGSACDLTDSPQEVASYILSKSPMAVLMITLHLEIITQAHYVDSVRDNAATDPLFSSLLKHHWLEEAQHAKLDALELEKLRAFASEEQVATAEAEYEELLGAFAGLLGRQATLDVGNLERATGTTYSPELRAEIENAQRLSYWRAFLWYGLTNSQFLEYLGERFPNLRTKADELAARYC